MAHLQFAMKREGLDFQAAMLALTHINDHQVGQAFLGSPSSAYLRQTAYLWELTNQKELDAIPAATGPYSPLFDREKLVTGSIRRNARWRVDFNGIGTTDYCPTVRRAPELQHLLASNILEQANEFIASLDKDMPDRAVKSAYLSETQGSFAIENETPTTSKA